MIATRRDADPNALPEPFVVIDRSAIGLHAWIRAFSTVIESRLGDEVFVGYRCNIEKAEIQDAAMIASRCSVEPGAIVGEAAWVCAGARIDSGVRIGRGAVVGAGAHVVADVPDLTLALGRPATRFISRRVTDAVSLPSPIETIRSVLRRSDFYQMPWPEGSVVEADVLNDARLHGGKGVKVGGESVLMGRSTAGTPHGGIQIGSGVEIGEKCILEASGGLKIGDRSVIGAGVTILTSSHDHTKFHLPHVAAPVCIGADVTIEPGAMLIGPLCVNDGALVRSNHIVKQTIEENAISHSIV